MIPNRIGGHPQLPTLFQGVEDHRKTGSMVVTHDHTAVIPPRQLPDYASTAKIPIPPRPHPLLRWEVLLIIAVLLIAGLAHGINMLHYPYYENDEGTYMSQAWALVHQGRLAY